VFEDFFKKYDFFVYKPKQIPYYMVKQEKRTWTRTRFILV